MLYSGEPRINSMESTILQHYGWSEEAVDGGFAFKGEKHLIENVKCRHSSGVEECWKMMKTYRLSGSQWSA